MSWDLDHVLFATSDADSVEQALTEFGLAFTERRVHQGQGTANACAIFENAYFEILRPSDRAEELRSDVVRPLGLDERIRWRDTGACPFGLCFRPSDAEGDPQTWPFQTWGYDAAYMPRGMSIPMVTPAHCLSDPLVFIAPRPSKQTHREAPLHHGARRTLTRVEVHRPGSGSPVSEGVRWFLERGLFSLQEGAVHAIELEWDHGRERKSHRLPHSAPILVRW